MNRRDWLYRLALGTSPVLINSAVNRTAAKLQPVPALSPMPGFGDGRDWFFSKRFGMFIHWGLYAIPAWHEQIQWRAGISRAEYAKLINQFNPKQFSPSRWLDLLQEAGMEYLTFTTKHHDGFCMWNTAQTDFNVMHSPYGADILGKLSDVCHERKIPLCLYYSIVDWHHPNYPNQGRHHELSKPETGDIPDWNRYMEFLKAQVKELCSNYGEIHGFWWDMNVPDYKDASVNEMIRKLQPNAVINNRGFDEGDFGTPERDDGSADKQKTRPEEACQSLGSLSWGYKKDEEYYTDKFLENSIDRYLSSGANFLLNIGPDAKGVMPSVPAATLRRIGKWYKAVHESYNKTEDISLHIKDSTINITHRENVLYVHLNKELPARSLSLRPITMLPRHAVLLNSGKQIECRLVNTPMDFPEKKLFLRLENLPVHEWCDTTAVIRLEFDNFPL